MADEMQRKTVTVEEAARMLGIGRTLAYEAIRRGEFPTAVIRIGNRWVIPRAALEAVLATPVEGPAWGPAA